MARSIWGAKSKLAFTALALGNGAGAATIANAEDPPLLSSFAPLYPFASSAYPSQLNRCPTSSYDQVCQVVKKELGGPPEEIFKEFDPVPIASASLAQVHVARTHRGQKVAVKVSNCYHYIPSYLILYIDNYSFLQVQHMHMTDTAVADYATVELIVTTLHWIFPSFDYRWLIDEVHESLPKELDFLNEANNSIKCMDNFRRLSPHIAEYVYAPMELDFLNEANNSIKCMDNFRRLSPHIAEYVYAPAVYWNLSTSKLLTMEFVEGPQVNDLKSIQKLGLNPHDIAKLVSFLSLVNQKTRY
ncbi:putative ABC1 protein At2g40090 [Bidens hawaiensis]|uniref:putative ABC1 protein At2g40090 n=1 Tax=Bidens hawaiensis TaxID=980011 RepID=UPI00404AEA39